MSKELSMNGRKKIETLQKEFTEKFNYLTLIFLDEDKKSLDVSKSLVEVRTKKGADISVMASLKVNTLEERFKENFGIIVEVAYSKEGKIVHTKDTVNKTLNELNVWCEKNGCDKFIFKKALTGNTLLSVQEQLFNALAEHYQGAEAKKINKDNYIDIYLPSINSKRGTHLFFNTGKNEIKIGFYVRDEDFISSILENGINVERYAQGVRIAGNPSYPDVTTAIDAALEFLSNFSDNKKDSDQNEGDENLTMVQKFMKYYTDDLAALCDELMERDDFKPSKMGVYSISSSWLSDAVDEAGNMILGENMLQLEGFVDLNDWDALSNLIGEKEATENRNLYSDEDYFSDAKIIFIYSDGGYMYSFLDHGHDENSETYLDQILSNINDGNEFQNMQLIKLKQGFEKVIPKDLFWKISNQNEFIYVQGDNLGISYNLDLSDINDPALGESEEEISEFINNFEEVFPKLKKFFAEDFEIVYFTYTGEYTVTMWSYKNGKMYKSSGWIGDYCQDCESDLDKDNFVDQHYPLLKAGDPQIEILNGLRDNLKNV